MKLPTRRGIETRSALYILLSVKVGLLPLVVTHLRRGSLSWLETRQAQLEAIGSFIGGDDAAPGRVPPHIPILPPILLGDPGTRRRKVPRFGDAFAPSDGGLGFVDSFAVAGEGPARHFRLATRTVAARSGDKPADRLHLAGKAGAQDRLTVRTRRCALRKAWIRCFFRSLACRPSYTYRPEGQERLTGATSDERGGAADLGGLRACGQGQAVLRKSR